MVLVLPLNPGIYAVNILCRLLTCKYPYSIPEIKYDYGRNIASLNYLKTNELGRSGGLGDNEIDIGDEDFYNIDDSPEPNIVSASYGNVEGYYMTTSGGRKIGAFEGIRYGNAERWELAKPIKFWKGVLNAKKPGPDCAQLHLKKFLKIYGEEDCLYLNVYTPVISGNKRKAKLPVIVYIHGGAFIFGTGKSYGPAYLLNEDILLVNLNYRLGTLGFMSTGDKVLPGNIGLKDQALAIRWVYENIKHFGGDPKRIILHGYSAGSVSVHLHMMSNHTKHLIYKAISQSGSAFAPWAVYDTWRARENTERFAKIFNCPTKISEDLLRCMKNVDALSIVAAQPIMLEWFPLPPTIFGPTVERVYDNRGNEDPSSYITDLPENLYKQGKVAPVPWITSVTAILVFQLIYRWSATKLYWQRVAKHILDLEYLSLPNERKVINEITRHYLGDKKTTRGTELEYANMITDRYFHVPFVQGVQAHSSIAPVYTYLFKFHNGSFNVGNLNLYSSQEWGAGHGEEEFYTFNSTIDFPGFKRSDPEHKISRFMIDYITHFIYSDVPKFKSTLDEKEEEKLVDWKPVVNRKKILTLQIDDEVKMITFDTKRLKLWKDLNLPDANLYTLGEY